MITTANCRSSFSAPNASSHERIHHWPHIQHLAPRLCKPPRHRTSPYPRTCNYRINCHLHVLLSPTQSPISTINQNHSFHPPPSLIIHNPAIQTPSSIWRPVGVLKHPSNGSPTITLTWSG